MYSLRYGTVPIVRKTGGLADTVFDWHELQAYGSDAGNGFSFHDAQGYALQDAVWRAVGLFDSNKLTWRHIQLNGMREDRSWDSSARKYVKLYEIAMARRRG
jgi:starch synthase